jgi:drug/metabolite transporter (DMT)-like permease
LIIVTLSEATIGVFVKLTGDAVPVFTLNFYRVFFAFLFLLAIVPFLDKNFWKVNKQQIRPIIIIGLLIALQISFFNIAMTLAPIANVVIFWSIAPFFVFIFSALFLKEKVEKEHIFIFLIAITGIFLAKPLAGGDALGNLVALFDGAVYAALVTYMRYEGTHESTNLICWFMLAAAIILSPALFIFGPGELLAWTSNGNFAFSAPTVLWVVCLGMISTGMAYFFITVALKEIKAAVYSLVDIIVSPVVAAFFGYLVFTEIPSENTIYGGILLLVSGFWLTHHMTEQEGLAKKIWRKLFHPRTESPVTSPMIDNKQIK